MSTEKLISKLHAAACSRAENSYTDPETGFSVLTACYLETRGYCCGAGCRHCPYPADVQRRAGRPEDPPTPATRT